MPEGEGVPDVEEEPEEKEEEQMINETMFTFDQFERVCCPYLQHPVNLLTPPNCKSGSRTLTSRARSWRTYRATRSSRTRSR